MNRALLLTAMLVVCVAAPARATIPAPPSQWYHLPGLNHDAGAQWVRAFASGTPPNVVYAGLEGGGVFRSTNGGATWSAFNDGFPNPTATNVRALLASSAGTTVYAGTDAGIYKSTGGAWEPLAQGDEEDPAKPKKLDQSVQSLVSLTGQSTMLAGVASGGVYKSTDDGATWQRPAANNGMPSVESVYGLTSTVPGLVYATGHSGVYASTDAGSTWTRVSDGIPGSASPITTWAYPENPNILFTSTASNGIYRSVTGGRQWREINDGLSAVRARGFQIFPGDQGAHLYAATESGLWHAVNGASPASPAPRWKAVTKDGLATAEASNEIMWALTAPSIPGAGALGLIAGTQSDGGFFLGLEPVDSNCPEGNPNATSDCPQVNGTPEVGKQLLLTRGTWTGTELIDYEYQWQQCTGTTADTCSDIQDAEEETYVVPESATSPNPHLRYRVEVTASNPAPSFGLVKRYSPISAAAVPNASQYPGSNQASAPSISVVAPGKANDPNVGDTLYAEYGLDPATHPQTDGWFNPKATSIAYRWLRCESFDDCNEIPGAFQRTYKTVQADGTKTLRVRVTGTNPSGIMALTSGPTVDIRSLPAEIGDDLPPDEPGGQPKSQAPSIAGEAFVGETLAGDVGGWKDPTTDFRRRWMRCGPDGGSCEPLSRPVSAEPEDGSTYTVQADDVGSTLRMRVTADVNGDLTPDATDNHLPHAVDVDTPPTAVVAFRPGSPPAVTPTPTPAGGQPAADTTAPTLAGLRLGKAKVRRGKKVTIRLRLSEAANVLVGITREAKGRMVKGRCRPKKKANRRKPKCRYQKTVATLRRAAAAGDVAIGFNRKLKPARYRATIVATDAAGNTSAAGVLQFRVVRR